MAEPLVRRFEVGSVYDNAVIEQRDGNSLIVRVFDSDGGHTRWKCKATELNCEDAWYEGFNANNHGFFSIFKITAESIEENARIDARVQKAIDEGNESARSFDLRDYHRAVKFAFDYAQGVC